jgi:hypothetical protein
MSSMLSWRAIRRLCLILLSVASVPCQATVVEWTLNDVTLASTIDARTYTAVGSFSYDTQSLFIEGWNLVAKEDSDPRTWIFKRGLWRNSASWTLGPPDVFTFSNDSGFLTLLTPASLTNAGTVTLAGGHLFGAFDFADANVSGGKLVGSVIPEPNIEVLMTFGLVTLIGIRRIRAAAINGHSKLPSDLSNALASGQSGGTPTPVAARGRMVRARRTSPIWQPLRT